jgi:hypothetical protein
MLRQLISVCLCLWCFSFVSGAIGQERKDLSIDDVIDGFQKKKLFYFEVLLVDEKYSKTFNECLSSKPANFKWMKTYCKKNLRFKHSFQCADDNKLIHVWFIYESEKECEETREGMQKRMDTLRHKVMSNLTPSFP